jgi:hypothetical protein
MEQSDFPSAAPLHSDVLQFAENTARGTVWHAGDPVLRFDEPASVLEDGRTITGHLRSRIDPEAVDSAQVLDVNVRRVVVSGAHAPAVKTAIDPGCIDGSMSDTTSTIVGAGVPVDAPALRVERGRPAELCVHVQLDPVSADVPDDFSLGLDLTISDAR